MTANKEDRTKPPQKKPAKRSEKERPSLGKLHPRETRWWSAEAKRWYILIVLSMIFSVLLFPNLLTQHKIYRIGDVAERDIKAPREFLVENNALTEKDRQEAAKSAPPVYDFDPTATDLSARIREAFRLGRNEPAGESPATPGPDESGTAENATGPSAGEDAPLKEQFFDLLGISPVDALYEDLAEADFPPEVEAATIQLLNEVLRKGVVSDKAMLMRQGDKGIVLHHIQSEKESSVTDLNRFYDLEEAKALFEEQQGALADTLGTEKPARLAAKLAAELLRPNLTFNKRETELKKEQARESVKPSYFKVKKGEMLVREGERISEEHLLKLTEQNKSMKRKDIVGMAPAMAVLIGFLLMSLYLVGLMNPRSSKGEPKDLLFEAITLLAIFLVVIAWDFISQEASRGFDLFTPRTLLFALPLASGAMLISVFQGMGVAATFSLVSSVLACLAFGGQVQFFIYFFVSSLVAAHGVKVCRDRGIFIKTGLKVGAVNMVLAFCMEALSGSIYSFETAVALAAAFFGGILVGIIATGTLPLVEMSFGYTTDIKLLELANLDEPLLRELMVQAPGTYHHSVIVSNMVEATAKDVNANPLLAKVAAYYHDIGKMRKPLYFVENQEDRRNKHEKLAPSMSALILISHVKEGVELARKHKLGREILDIIRQHHGTSLITYFYERAKTQASKKEGKSGKIKEEDFRYPGPKPQTKEAGLIMLADAVEAASRSINEPTAARIRGMVQKIINKAFSDGQLDECELTLKDLHKIAKSFNTTLSGIFHHRIEYPEITEKTMGQREAAGAGGTRSKKVENGHPDSHGQGESRSQGKADRAEAGESLRRLGIS